jgi:hypothetical protein
MPFARRHQKAVTWARSGYGRDGQPIVSSPTEIDVRWESGLAQEVRPVSNPIAIDVTLWTSEDLTSGSMVWLGSEDELGTADPTEVYEVVEVQKIPDVKGRVYERVALLSRFRESLPTLA